MTMANLETGRSMVEMLGTLAIMGILSIGGIAGYNYGINKHRANQVLQDIRLVYQELKYPNTVHQIVSEGSFPDIELDLQSPYEYGFDFANPDDFIYDSTSETTPNLISVNVSGVSKTACDILLKSKPEYVLMLKANGQSTWNCMEDENELSYIFEITTDKLEYGKCTVCTGEHCFDDDLNCPEGEYCYNDTCSKCAAGYTENKSGTCTSCSFYRNLNLTQENCHRCGDTMYGFDPNRGSDTNCYPCSQVDLSRTTKEYCQRCMDVDPKVMWFADTQCVNCKNRFYHASKTTKEECLKCEELGEKEGFIWNEKLGEASGVCVWCTIGDNKLPNDAQNGCICQTEGTFWGLNDSWASLNSCFSCSISERKATTKSSCDRCPQRKFVGSTDNNGFCYLCPEGQVKSADGRSCVDKPAE